MNIAEASASLRSRLIAATVCAASVVSALVMAACSDGADGRPLAFTAAAATRPVSNPPAHETARPAPASASRGLPSSQPEPGSAALHDYREDVDPSHAAVASYSD